MEIPSINNHNKPNGQYNNENVFLPRIALNPIQLEKPEIQAIRKTKQIAPYNPYIQKMNTSLDTQDDNEIYLQFIEYVLKANETRFTDLCSNNSQGANSSKYSIDQYPPVKNDAMNENNQFPFKVPGRPILPKISQPRTPNVEVKYYGAPTIGFQPSNQIIFNNPDQIYDLSKTSRLVESTSNIGYYGTPTNGFQPNNQIMFNNPEQIYDLSKTSRLVESNFNIEQYGFPQGQNNSSFEEYFPHNTYPTIPNFKIKEETNIVYPPYYGTSMVQSFQHPNETKNYSSILQNALELNTSAYRMCNPSSHNIPLTQFSPMGNNIKSGLPILSAHDVKDELGSICPVILQPNKQLSSQVQVKNEALIKTIGFAPARSQMTAQAQSRIVTSSLQRSIMESQNVSPLIITPSSHVIHSANEIVPAKIVPIPSAPAVSHFSVINKTGSYDSIPEFAGIRQSLVSGTPPVYTQSDFARFPPKSYHHNKAVLNPAVIHGPIPGHIDEPCINIPNSQHLFKPIISPRPSILRKRDADGVLRAQKNLLPILTKPDPDECQNIDETSLNRNGYSETGLQIDSIMVPQIPEVRLLPQIAALTRQSHIMVEISPRKKPRKQLLPVNQEDSPFKIVGDDMEYVDEKLIKIEKSDDFPDDDLICNDDLIDGDAEDEAEDDLDDMDVDDDCPADDYDDDDDDDDDFGNDFGDEFDYVKSDKTFFEDVKTSVEVSDESSACIKPKNKRPTLLGSYKNTWRGHTHHFQRYTDFKIKETKKQLADMQQAKKWTSDSISGWRVRHLLDQFDGMITIEEEIIARMNELISQLEANIKDLKVCHNLVELVKDNIQRSRVSRAQLEDIRQQLKKVFDYKILIEDVVDKYCPKDLKKKYAKVFNLSKS